MHKNIPQQLHYPKQKCMYDPNIPPIRGKWMEDSLLADIHHLAQLLDQKPKSRSVSPINVVDRLYEKEKVKKNKILQKTREKEQLNEKPIKMSFVSKSSQRILSTMNLKPFLERQEDLNQDKKIKQELRKLMEKQIEKEQIPQIPSRSQEKFLKDSQDWVRHKLHKQELLKEELKDQNSTFRPLINTKSSKIIENKMKKSSISPITDRLSRPIQRSAQKEEIYSFSPCINKKSRQLAKKHKTQTHWN